MKICPDTAVNYTCNVSSYAGNTVWGMPSVGGCAGTTVTLAQAPQGPGFSCLTTFSIGTCGPFKATNTPPLTGNNCFTSTLSVVVTPAMDGLVVSCSSYNMVTFVTTAIGNATISILGKPWCIKHIETNQYSCTLLCTPFYLFLNPSLCWNHLV